MNQRQIIKAAFRKHYRDIGLYRLANRRIKEYRIYLLATFFGGVFFAALQLFIPAAVLGGMFITPIWLIGLDHFLIGISRNRIISYLREQHGIFSPWESLCREAGIK